MKHQEIKSPLRLYIMLETTVIPHIQFSSDFAMMFVAVAGTTISPYLFFWQTSEEAEEAVAGK